LEGVDSSERGKRLSIPCFASKMGLSCSAFYLFSEQSDGRRARADTDENLQANLVRAAKAVKREDVMRDDLKFHVLRITLVANSANIAADVVSQPQTTLFSKQATRAAARRYQRKGERR